MSDFHQHPDSLTSAEQRLGLVLEGKYRLVKLLGQGGMGSVYEAEHTLISRRVAIKMLRPEHCGSELATERILREAQTASSIGHPNIIDIQDVGRAQDGSVFIVMELLRGRSLADLIRASGKLSAHRALGIINPVLSGLYAAHAKGVIHRDLKPDNIFIAYDDIKGEEIKILDFGISKVANPELGVQTLTRTGAVLGTPYYMSPEQASGEKDVDARSDLWAVGVMLYEMLTGQLPFSGDSYNAVIARILTRPVPPLHELASDAPEALTSAVHKALTKDREGRFATALEFAQSLLSLTGGLAPGMTPDTSLLDTMGAEESARSDTDGRALALASTTPDPSKLPSGQRASTPPSIHTPDVRSGVAVVRSDTDPGARHTPVESPSGRRLTRPTLDVVGQAPTWKTALWFLITLPLAWLPGSIGLNLEDEALLDMLGVADKLPWSVAVVTVVAISLGSSAAAVLVARFWRKGVWNVALQGRFFVLIPAAGLTLILFHYLQLSGQQYSHYQSLHAYTAINLEQAAALVDGLQASNDRFLAATSLDQVIVWLVATIVLLGYVFVRPLGTRAPASRTRWLVLPAGLCIIVVAELLVPYLAHGGLWRFGLYLMWLLTAIAVLRIREPQGDGFQVGWQALRAGVIASVAVTGAQISLGFFEVFGALKTYSMLDMPPEEREVVFRESARPIILHSTVSEWALLIVLFGLLIYVCRHAFPRGATRGPDARRTLLAAALAVVVTALPIVILSQALSGLSRQWLPYKLSAMQPVALQEGQPLSFYIDKEAQSLYPGRTGFFVALTDEHRELYDESVLRDAMAFNVDPEADASCKSIVTTALHADDPQPARCITALEAQRYCEGRGMRLPRPDEWTAALGAVAPHVSHRPTAADPMVRRPFGEWAMHIVLDKESFVVQGRELDESIPDLRAERSSPMVGFRCAFTFAKK